MYNNSIKHYDRAQEIKFTIFLLAKHNMINRTIINVGLKIDKSVYRLCRQ